MGIETVVGIALMTNDMVERPGYVRETVHLQVCTTLREKLAQIERLRKELDAVTKDRDDLQEKYNELVLSR